MIVMEELLTPEEAAKVLRISEYTVKRFLREGKIAGTKVGGQWRIERAELLRYINRSQPPQGAQQDKN